MATGYGMIFYWYHHIWSNDTRCNEASRTQKVGQEMQVNVKAHFCLLYAVVVLSVTAQEVDAQPPSPPRIGRIQKPPVADVLSRLGARLEQGASANSLDDYSRHFDRTDPNRDGKHTREEYVEKGVYMTPQARAGIFRAADGNADGVVTRSEYVLNRIITDEAKAIVQGMDEDGNGLVERVEFVKHAAKLCSDPDLAEQVFAALDANGDSRLPIPEYLRVWGQWAVHRAQVGRRTHRGAPSGTRRHGKQTDRCRAAEIQRAVHHLR